LSFTPAMAARAHRHRNVVFRAMANRPCFREIRLAWIKRPLLTRGQQAVVEAAKLLHTGAVPDSLRVPRKTGRG
jgi:hypothetical protein